MITKVHYMESRKQKVPFKVSDKQQGLLMPVGDVHWGSVGFPKDHFVEHLKWGTDRGAYFLGMGDYLDFTSTTQREIIGKLRDSTKEFISEQIRGQVEEMAEAIKFTKGSWIGMLVGNHTWTFQDGTNVEQLLCSRLGCDYLGDMTMIRLIPKELIKHHPEVDTILVAHHGKGGGQTIGGQLNKPEHLMKWLQADIYLMGHTHAKLVGTIDRILVTPDGVTSHRTTMVARTGAFLKAYEGHEPLALDKPAFLSEGSYVEKAALMPSSLGGICLSIGAEKISGSDYFRPVIHYCV